MNNIFSNKYISSKNYISLVILLLIFYNSTDESLKKVITYIKNKTNSNCKSKEIPKTNRANIINDKFESINEENLLKKNRKSDLNENDYPLKLLKQFINTEVNEKLLILEDKINKEDKHNEIYKMKLEENISAIKENINSLIEKTKSQSIENTENKENVSTIKENINSLIEKIESQSIGNTENKENISTIKESINSLIEKTKSQSIYSTENKENISTIKENINLIIEKIESQSKESTENKEKFKQSTGLLDILRENYQGVNITLLLVDSSSLTGEVLKSTNEVLVIKNNGIHYFIAKDKILYFY